MAAIKDQNQKSGSETVFLKFLIKSKLMLRDDFGSHFYIHQQECYKIWSNKNNQFFGQFSEKNATSAKTLKIWKKYQK